MPAVAIPAVRRPSGGERLGDAVRLTPPSGASKSTSPAGGATSSCGQIGRRLGRCHRPGRRAPAAGSRTEHLGEHVPGCHLVGQHQPREDDAGDVDPDERRGLQRGRDQVRRRPAGCAEEGEPVAEDPAQRQGVRGPAAGPAAADRRRAEHLRLRFRRGQPGPPGFLLHRLRQLEPDRLSARAGDRARQADQTPRARRPRTPRTVRRSGPSGSTSSPAARRRGPSTPPRTTSATAPATPTPVPPVAAPPPTRAPPSSGSPWTAGSSRSR